MKQITGILLPFLIHFSLAERRNYTAAGMN